MASWRSEQARQKFQHMSPAGQRLVLGRVYEGVEKYCTEVLSPYLERRRRRGIRTPTDVTGEEFLGVADELLMLLEDLIEERRG